MKTIAFFNNKGGVGKTTLLFHLAHMIARLGHAVVAIDLDPQANLTAMCLADEDIETLWQDGGRSTVYSAMQPLLDGTGDVLPVQPRNITTRMWLLPGDLALSSVEDELSAVWPGCLSGQPRAFRVTAAFDRLLRQAGAAQNVTLGLIDVGPNLGAINRCALVAADFVLIPTGADLFSLRGLQNVGPKLGEWRKGWRQRLEHMPDGLGFTAPAGSMTPIGYVVSRLTRFRNEPARAYQAWLDRVPATYAQEVSLRFGAPASDRLAALRDYRSLATMAQERRKPMFDLTPADGAIGAHQAAVRRCHDEFEQLAREVMRRCEVAAPSDP